MTLKNSFQIILRFILKLLSTLVAAILKTSDYQVLPRLLNLHHLLSPFRRNRTNGHFILPSTFFLSISLDRDQFPNLLPTESPAC